MEELFMKVERLGDWGRVKMDKKCPKGTDLIENFKIAQKFLNC